MKRNFILKTIAFLMIFSGISLNTNYSKCETLAIKESLVFTAPEPEKNDWDLFTEAVIWKESRGDESAIGDNGKAVGVLQLHPIMVDEANRILDKKNIGKRYSYEDRYSREKSIEMFNVIQDFYNKDKDLQLALDKWNPGHPDSYSNDIMNKYNELKTNV